jgi:hypothetical protein
MLKRQLARHVGVTAVFLAAAFCGAQTFQREMIVTAYCPCGECNDYSRGSWKFLKLDRWNRYVSAGSDRGQRYTGKTADGSGLKEARPGLISGDSFSNPSRVPLRILLPWRAFPKNGTIAADTAHYPFGTRMYVPGYGWGVVHDRGGAIKGPDRIDILMKSHGKTEQWGRQRVAVTVKY